MQVKIVVGLFFYVFLRCVLYSVRSLTGVLKAADTLNLFCESRVSGGVFVFLNVSGACSRSPHCRHLCFFFCCTVAFVCESLEVLKVILCHFPFFFYMLNVM